MIAISSTRSRRRSSRSRAMARSCATTAITSLPGRPPPRTARSGGLRHMPSFDAPTKTGLLQLLEDLRSHLAPIKENTETVDGWRDRLLRDDETVAEDLYFLFLPTGDLQDLSIAEGWGDEFLDL